MNLGGFGVIFFPSRASRSRRVGRVEGEYPELSGWKSFAKRGPPRSRKMARVDKALASGARVQVAKAGCDMWPGLIHKHGHSSIFFSE